MKDLLILKKHLDTNVQFDNGNDLEELIKIINDNEKEIQKEHAVIKKGNFVPPPKKIAQR